MLASARKRRQGVSLVEIALVIAIFGIMSAMAAQSMAGMVPSYRTKQAAREFYVNVQKARDLAIAEGREYRVRVACSDQGGELQINPCWPSRWRWCRDARFQQRDRLLQWQ